MKPIEYVVKVDEDGTKWWIVNGSYEKFIHLYNNHNGYYRHGFNFEINNQPSMNGTL